MNQEQSSSENKPNTKTTSPNVSSEISQVESNHQQQTNDQVKLETTTSGIETTSSIPQTEEQFKLETTVNDAEKASTSPQTDGQQSSSENKPNTTTTPSNASSETPQTEPTPEQKTNDQQVKVETTTETASSSPQTEEQQTVFEEHWIDRSKRIVFRIIILFLSICAAILGTYFYFMGDLSDFDSFYKQQLQSLSQHPSQLIEIIYSHLATIFTSNVVIQNEEECRHITQELFDATIFSFEDIKLLNTNFLIFPNFHFHVLSKIQQSPTSIDSNIRTLQLNTLFLPYVKHYSQLKLDAFVPVIHPKTKRIAILKLTLCSVMEEEQQVKEQKSETTEKTEEEQGKEKLEKKIVPMLKYSLESVSFCDPKPFISVMGDEFFTMFQKSTKNTQLNNLDYSFVWPFDTKEKVITKFYPVKVQALLPDVFGEVIQPEMEPTKGHFIPETVMDTLLL